MNKARPHDLGLKTMRLPAGAYASIWHRVTGVLLIGVTGLVLVLLRTSLQSAQGFQDVTSWVGGAWGQSVGPVIVWVVASHLYGGIRHLIFDAGFGFGRTASQRSAVLVMALALITAFIAALAWPS